MLLHVCVKQKMFSLCSQRWSVTEMCGRRYFGICPQNLHPHPQELVTFAHTFGEGPWQKLRFSLDITKYIAGEVQ